MRKPSLYASLSDEAILSEYRLTMDQQLVAALYRRYSDLILGVCFKYLENADDAADACADIYGQLVSKLPHHEVGYFKGWLYVLTRNHCLQLLRGRKKLAISQLSEADVYSEDNLHLEDVMNREVQLNALQSCIDQLRDDQKVMVDLFYLQELSYQQIVEKTGQPWNIVRSHIQNGRRNLKNCMEQVKSNG